MLLMPDAELPEVGIRRPTVHKPIATAPPPYRRVRVYPFDPSTGTSLSTVGVNEITLRIPWESSLPADRDPGTPANCRETHDLQPGPVGEYLDVIDYDPATGCFYEPVDLNDPSLLAQDGIAPTEGNPQFHQQMVYAVAMNTISVFERATGRRIQWSPRIRKKAELTDDEKSRGVPLDQFVRRLRLYPHAMRAANAYYSPEKKALLFGYFPSDSAAASDMLPGSMIFTCLSHDVIAHELTHAILDGLQQWFIQPTNPDVLAFHEGFSDIVALLQRCSYPEVLRHQLRQCKGNLRSSTMLAELAGQFGRAIGMHGGLRNALGIKDSKTKILSADEPDPKLYQTVAEPHARGAILVAALFDAFVSIYQRRTEDLIRLATGGSGILPGGEVHPDLLSRLAGEAAKSARHVLNICIRAIDYCPPVDITFGDYLRAMITADKEMVPDDQYNYRVAFIEAFRRHGIYPLDVRTMSEDALIWRPPALTEIEKVRGAISQALRWVSDDSRDVVTKILGKPLLDLGEIVPKWNMHCDRRDVFDLIIWLQAALHQGFNETPECLRAFGIDPRVHGGQFQVRALRPIRREDQRGESIVELVFSIVQRKPMSDTEKAGEGVAEDNNDASDSFLGGSTVVLNAETGEVRYVIRKNINSENRMKRWQEFRNHESGSLASTYCGERFSSDEPFAMLHGMGESLE